jgi:hypothetical protein
VDLRQEGDASGRPGRGIDPDTETIFVNLTKDEIKNAPEFDENTYRDESYRNRLGSYYSGRGI